MKREVIMTQCFESGHQFYSARLGATVYQGFLCPGDEFKFSELYPRIWEGRDWTYTNFTKGSMVPTLGQYHVESIKRFKEKPLSLPSRLRKYFK